MKEKTVTYQNPEEMSDLEISQFLGNLTRASAADSSEIMYQSLRHLRTIAADILPDKIQTSQKRRTQDFEALCNTILFSFDDHNFHAVAERIGVTDDALQTLLLAAAIGARLQRQFQSTRPRGARPPDQPLKAGQRGFQSTRPRGARPDGARRQARARRRSGIVGERD